MILSSPPPPVERCGWCSADLRGEPLGWAPGRFASRAVPVAVLGVYDGALYWECPECCWRWHRWPEGDWRHGRAVPFVEGQPGPVVARGVNRRPDGDEAAWVRETLVRQSMGPVVQLPGEAMA